MTDGAHDHTQGHTTGTVAGLIAIVLWSTTFGVARDAIESLGVFTAGACMYTLAGVFGVLPILCRPKHLRAVMGLSKAYLLLCGGLCVAYLMCMNTAIGLAANRQQVIEVGIINYLWPSLTLLVSVPILGKRARVWLVPGIALSFVGVGLAMQQGGEFSWAVLRANLRTNYGPWLFALVGAVSWALYSALSNRFKREHGAAPFFLLAAGLAIGVGRCFVTETSTWTPSIVAGVIYMAAFPACLAYILWDVAMRRGNMVLVTSLSYFTPLLATVFSCLYLGVSMGWALWLACALVIAGALISRHSVKAPVHVGDHGDAAMFGGAEGGE